MNEQAQLEYQQQQYYQQQQQQLYYHQLQYYYQQQQLSPIYHYQPNYYQQQYNPFEPSNLPPYSTGYQQQQEEHIEPFYYDQEPLLPQQEINQLSQLSTIPEYQYSSQARQVLGTSAEDKTLHPLEIRRCFNCGDPSHTLLGCPSKRNQSLIKLTKQIFQAHNEQNHHNNSVNHHHHHGDDHQQQFEGRLKDFHSEEESGKQSLERRRTLAASFRPGKISAPLREALFWDPSRALPDENYLDPFRPMPWFQAMEKWGYPPGYAIPLNAQHNPFKQIFARIEDSSKDHAWESTEILEMHRGRSPRAEDDSDSDDEEEEILRLLVPGYAALHPPPPAAEGPPLDNASFLDPKLLPPLPPDSPPPPPPTLPTTDHQPAIPLKRLVKYRGGNFSSDRLPVYNGQMISTQAYLDFQSGNPFSSFKLPHQQHQQHAKWKNGTRKNSLFSQQQQQQSYQQFVHQDPHSGQPSLSTNSSDSPSSSTVSSPISYQPNHSPDSTAQELAVVPSIGHRIKNNVKLEGGNHPSNYKPTKNPSKIIKQRWKDAALTFAAAQLNHPHQYRHSPSPTVVPPPLPPHDHPLPGTLRKKELGPKKKNGGSGGISKAKYYVDNDQPSPSTHHHHHHHHHSSVNRQNQNLNVALDYGDDGDDGLGAGPSHERPLHQDHHDLHQEEDQDDQEEDEDDEDDQQRRQYRSTLPSPSSRSSSTQQPPSLHPHPHHRQQSGTGQHHRHPSTNLRKRLRSANFHLLRHASSPHPSLKNHPPHHHHLLLHTNQHHTSGSQLPYRPAHGGPVGPRKRKKRKL